MNEEHLADMLADHLDLLLEGKASPETPPDDVAGLLQVAQNLVESAPTPRPEFGPALKKSLLGPTSGKGINGSGGSIFGNYILLVIVGSLILAVILALLASTVIFGTTFLGDFEEPSSTPLPAQPQVIPAQLTPLPTPTATASTVEPIPTVTGEAVATGKAIDSLPLPTSTPTIVLDILSPITITVETVEEIPPSPSDLMPAQTTSSDDDNDGDSSSDNGGGGDHDDDHHDD